MGANVLFSIIPCATVLALCVVGIARERRLAKRDRLAFALGRHIFDQTRCPTVLSDLAAFEKPGNSINIRPMIEAPPAADSG